ncbi:MAG: hypothetical protein A2580_07560 [Hydrogenophilales bacterium RIFOXYD1_FULL_62_11]|nr:MAG: hypothetical protein A2580_07560 [Hydrogenophilales bacterium RIFOXYD1_FULL_62_11]
MLTEPQSTELKQLVSRSLDRAEDIWNKVGREVQFLEARLTRAEAVPSSIPGHSWVSEDRPLVDTFVAAVVDIRDSSKHLLHAISQKEAKVSQLQRVFYETSALLPAVAQTLGYQKGRVTEYLGDGVLALFQVEPGEEKRAMYRAYWASQDCIGGVRSIVNNELARRYSLPALDLGVGLSFSKAIVTLVGLDGEKHPKAVGECVYRAAKLSKGRNEVYVDEWLKNAWPSEKGGFLQFLSRTLHGEQGYLLHAARAKAPVLIAQT